MSEQLRIACMGAVLAQSTADLHNELEAAMVLYFSGFEECSIRPNLLDAMQVGRRFRQELVERQLRVLYR